MLAAERRFELIVIGGGVNGAAIAREAALHDVDVLLLEREDFCAGTSAAATRLIHGGLRYLEHAELALVRESLRERRRLLECAPHLVAPLEIFLPLFRDSRRGPLTIRLGMWLYDLLSLGKAMPRHRMLGPAALGELMPGLAAERLVGGAAYHDAQVTFPERLVLEIALDAAAAGATLATHTEARELVVEDGRIAGVAWRSAGANGVARAPVVVNAAGPWVDAVLGRIAGAARPELVGGTRGSHLITRAFKGAPNRAVYAEAGSDGRPFFIIPWNRLYLIGTTDERYDGDPGEAAMTRSEYDYLVAETRRLFPSATDLDDCVCYTYAGIRPLPATSGVSPGAITRRHLIEAHPDVLGLYSIVGGKLTTHRATAADCLRRLGRELDIGGRSPTAVRPLPGALEAAERDALVDALARTFGRRTGSRLWHLYGGASRQLLDSARARPELGQRIGPDCELLVGELVHAIERERAVTLTDLMLRRTMAGLDADLGRRQAPPAADRLVRLGIWDKGRAAEELAAYRSCLRRFAVPV